MLPAWHYGRRTCGLRSWLRNNAALLGYAADDDGLAGQRRIIPLLDGSVESIHVNVQEHVEIPWSTEAREPWSTMVPRCMPKQGELVGVEAKGHPVKLTIYTRDRQGLLADVTAAISDVHSNIKNIEARTGDSQASIDVTLDIVDLEHLEKIMSSLRKIDGVYQIERVMH